MHFSNLMDLCHLKNSEVGRASRAKSKWLVEQHNLLQYSQRTSAEGHTMEHLWQDAHTDAQTRNKQKDQCQTMGRFGQVSRFGTTGSGVLNVCTRTETNKSSVSITGQIQEGRLAAGEKSLPNAPPYMHCCQPCRQSRSRAVHSR